MIPSQRMSRNLFLKVSLIFFALLVCLSWYFILIEQEGALRQLFSPESKEYALAFLRDLMGVGYPKPAFLDLQRWKEALGLTYETLMMSILAVGIAGFGALLTVIPAARNAADGTLTLHTGWWSWTAYVVLRGAYILSRAIPELVWALLIVFIFTPGMIAGGLALALHNYGILGKLWAEVVEDIDLRPIRALRAAGAGTGQTLFYAVLPTVLPQFLTFLLYRWEVIIRTTIVVGFVAAGGLGREFRLSMAWFQYTDITLLLLCYLALVFLVDFISAGLRRLAR